MRDLNIETSKVRELEMKKAINRIDDLISKEKTEKLDFVLSKDIEYIIEENWELLPASQLKFLIKYNLIDFDKIFRPENSEFHYDTLLCSADIFYLLSIYLQLLDDFYNGEVKNEILNSLPFFEPKYITKVKKYIQNYILHNPNIGRTSLSLSLVKKILKFKKYIEDVIDIEIIYSSQIMTMTDIKELIEEGYYIDWKSISSYYKLTEEFMEKYEEYLDWEEISTSQNFSEKFLEKYYMKLNLEKVFIRCSIIDI